jgi:hypothetical protein
MLWVVFLKPGLIPIGSSRGTESKNFLPHRPPKKIQESRVLHVHRGDPDWDLQKVNGKMTRAAK